MPITTFKKEFKRYIEESYFKKMCAGCKQKDGKVKTSVCVRCKDSSSHAIERHADKLYDNLSKTDKERVIQMHHYQKTIDSLRRAVELKL